MEGKQQALPIGTKIDRYEIMEILGVGGFGVTYKAWDPQLAVEVAIKEFLPLELAGRESYTTGVVAHASRTDEYRYGLDRFLEEARTLARFKHNNVVRVGNFLEANGTAYLVMEFEQGQSLSEYLKVNPEQIAEKQLISWFTPILSGLMEVHKAGFLHRDIKPGNIYLREEGEPLLIDFGAARQAIGEHSRSVTGIVSAGYAPTEQYGSDAKKQGPWTDLYSVGATLYRCISGKEPVDAPTRQSAVMEGDSDPMTPATQMGEGSYSQAFLKLIDELLVLLIKRRPESAESVLSALTQNALPPTRESHSTVVTRKVTEDVAIAEPLEASAVSTPKKASVKRLRKGFFPKAIGVVAVLLAIGIGGILIGNINVKKFLPESAEERQAKAEQEQAQYNAVVQLEGEVTILAEKLRLRGQGELDALGSEMQLATDGWTFRQRIVHESARFTELKGLQILGSRQLEDKMYAQAQVTLEETRQGLQHLLDLDRVAEDLTLVWDELREAKDKYELMTAAYELTEPTVLGEARSKESEARQAESIGELKKARNLYRDAAHAWIQAISQTESEITQIDLQRTAEAAEKQRLAAKAEARAREETQARAEAKALAQAQKQAEQQAAEVDFQQREQAEKAARQAEQMAKNADFERCKKIAERYEDAMKIHDACDRFSEPADKFVCSTNALVEVNQSALEKMKAIDQGCLEYW